MHGANVVHLSLADLVLVLLVTSVGRWVRTGFGKLPRSDSPHFLPQECRLAS